MLLQAIRRSIKGERNDTRPHHISITPKSAIAILPPKKVCHTRHLASVPVRLGADGVLVLFRSSKLYSTTHQNLRTGKSLPSIKATSSMLLVGKMINSGMRHVIRLSPMPEAWCPCHSSRLLARQKGRVLVQQLQEPATRYRIQATPPPEVIAGQTRL